jgi:hypothetical protein
VLPCSFFSALRITVPEVATSRLHAANVVPDNPGAHVGAWFNYDYNTFAVQSIANGFCYCNSIEVEGITIELPLDLVNNIVSSFGSLIRILFLNKIHLLPQFSTINPS